MAKRVLIFDFDGTLCESFDALMRAVNSFSDEFGYKKIRDEDLPALRDKTSKDVLLDLGISMMKLPFLTRKVRKAIQDETSELAPVSGIAVILQQLKSRGFRLGILTSNSKQNVEKFLESHSLDIYFDFVHSGSSLFGKGKVLKEMLKVQGANLDEVLYIGDETRDVDAARSAKVGAVSVCWGFNSKQILEKQSPDFLIEHPSGLLEITQ